MLVGMGAPSRVEDLGSEGPVTCYSFSQLPLFSVPFPSLFSFFLCPPFSYLLVFQFLFLTLFLFLIQENL